jgi:putative zinc finger/helix-turn-helix YgiT family protein
MNEILEMMIQAATEEAAARTSNGKPCSCEGASEETTVSERVPIGEHGDYFVVEVPIIHCLECGVRFRDHRAEKLRHAAACRHEGLLTPEEIRSIRESLGMTRKAFAEAFRIPPASMERWENGKLMQNGSSDMLLRALQLPGVATALDKRVKVTPRADASNVIYVNFAALAARSPAEQRDAIRRSKAFDLRAQA